MRRVVAVGAVASLALLGGCGASAGGDDGDEQARAELVQFLRKTAVNSHTTDVNDVARAAVGLGGPRVIGIDPAAEPSNESIGTLTFAVWVTVMPYTGTAPDPEPRCIEVEFDPWGKVGEFGTDDGLTDVDCPDDLTEVTPPPSDDPAIAPNADEAIRQVLEALPADGVDADEVVAQVTALLEEPEDGRPLAEVQVLVDGTDVAVATGGPDGCSMLVRVDTGVFDVHVSPVQLEVGESGCDPWTALDPPPPPH